MMTETRVKLDKFQPRPYQIPLINAVESGKYRKILALWCRRCLHGDTHIIMADGSFKLLKDIQEGDLILSWNGTEFETDRVKNVWKTEPKETLKISAHAMPDIITSRDHLFAYSYNTEAVTWKKAEDLQAHNQLQVYVYGPQGCVHNPDLAEFIGYMCSDGYCAGYQQPKFTNNNKVILDRVAYLADKLFDIKPILRAKGNGYDLGLSNNTLGGGETPNKVKELFRDYKLDIPKSRRTVHPILYTLDNESLYRFFAALISCDGSLYIHKAKTIYDKKRNRTSLLKERCEITISCGACEQYAWDLYWLFRKLGIVPQKLLCERGSNYKIKVTGHGVKQLLSHGPVYGKEAKQEQCLSLVSFSFPRYITNGCCRSCVAKKEYTGSIEPLYDIETTKNHNFVANGYLVHNSGKDVCGWNLIIRAAIRKVGNYFYCLPTFKQCRLVIFDSITIDGTRFLDYIPKELVRSINISEMKITLNNNSVIQLIGSDSYDTALVGTNPRMVIFSEAALSDERAYQFVRPIMNANLGVTVFLSTPRGHNWFYNLYEIARNSPEDWYSCKLTVDDCQHISIADIQKEIESGEMSEDMAQQEYWCSFDAGVEGSYYSKYLDKMKLENRITEVPWEPNFKVHLAMDIGYSDDTTIIWFQVIGTTIHVIDCYSRSKEGLEHYVNVIKSKPYTYGKCFAPHDIQVTEWGSGISRIEKAKQLGLKLVPLPKSDLMDGIELVRSTLPRVWIDQKCSNLIHALESYHQEYDSKRKVYNLRPLHDWSSHYADAMRYLALSVPRCRDTLTPEELDQRYYNAMLQGTEANMPKPFRNT